MRSWIVNKDTTGFVKEALVEMKGGMVLKVKDTDRMTSRELYGVRGTVPSST